MQFAVMACSMSEAGQSVGQLKVCMPKMRWSIKDKGVSLLHYLKGSDLYYKCLSATEGDPDE